MLRRLDHMYVPENELKESGVFNYGLQSTFAPSIYNQLQGDAINA